MLAQQIYKFGKIREEKKRLTPKLAEELDADLVAVGTGAAELRRTLPSDAAKAPAAVVGEGSGGGGRQRPRRRRHQGRQGSTGSGARG